MMLRTYKREDLTVLTGENYSKKEEKGKKRKCQRLMRKREKTAAGRMEENEEEVRDKCKGGGRERRGFGMEVMSSGDVETARRSKKIWRAR